MSETETMHPEGGAYFGEKPLRVWSSGRKDAKYLTVVIGGSQAMEMTCDATPAEARSFAAALLAAADRVEGKS